MCVGPNSWPLGVKPLLSIDIISQYSPLSGEYGNLGTSPPSGSSPSQSSGQSNNYGTTGPTQQYRTFALRHLNVLDPIDPHNNIGRSVTRHSFKAFRAAINEYNQRLQAVAMRWEESRNAAEAMHSLFGNVSLPWCWY